MNRLLLFSIVALLGFTACEVTTTEHIHIDPVDKFIGHYDMEEYSDTYGSYSFYPIHVEPIGEPNTILITNFYGAGVDVIGYVNGFYIDIPNQRVRGYYIEGSGYLNGNRLELDYSVHDHLAYHDVTDFCHSVAYR